MTGRGRRARGLAALALSAALAGVPGCDDPPPPVAPSGSPERADPLGAVSRCESGTIQAGAPRRVYDEEFGSCEEEYEVDFVVEAAPADAMLLDMFQAHTLRNWRVARRGETVRHEFTLRLRPTWSDGWSYPPFGVRPHEPIVIQRCPEGDGEGSVFACTTLRCGSYDDVSEVPRLTPARLQLAVSVPPRFQMPNFRNPIRDGETVEVPVTFRIYRPVPGGVTLTTRLRADRLSKYARVEVAPPEAHVETGTPRTETRIVSVTVRDYDYWGYVTEFKQTEPRFNVDIGTRGGPGCVSTLRDALLFRLLPPQDADALQSSSR